MPRGEQANRLPTRPKAVYESQWDRRRVGDRNVCVEQVGLVERRIKSEVRAHNLTRRNHFHLVRGRLDQSSNQFYLDRVGQAEVSDDRSSVTERGSVVRGNIRYPHCEPYRWIIRTKL